MGAKRVQALPRHDVVSRARGCARRWCRCWCEDPSGTAGRRHSRRGRVSRGAGQAQEGDGRVVAAGGRPPAHRRAVSTVRDLEAGSYGTESANLLRERLDRHQIDLRPEQVILAHPVLTRPVARRDPISGPAWRRRWAQRPRGSGTAASGRPPTACGLVPGAVSGSAPAVRTGRSSGQVGRSGRLVGTACCQVAARLNPDGELTVDVPPVRLGHWPMTRASLIQTSLTEPTRSGGRSARSRGTP